MTELDENIDPRKGKFARKYFYTGIILGGVIGGCVAFLLTRASITSTTSNHTFTATTIEKMQTIEEIIDTYYYTEYNTQDLLTGVYQGMVDSIDDAYADYYTIDELEKLMSNNEGIYYGIGVVVSKSEINNLLEVSRVTVGSPAEEADIREGDYIYQVNGMDIYDMTTQEAVDEITGIEGTLVEIVILRGDEEITLEIPRKKLENITIYYEMLEDNIANIRITDFDTVTINQFSSALEEAKEAGMEGLILDVRSNPGGQLQVVLEICRQLLPSGIIVYTEEKNGNRQNYTCNGQSEIDVPIVVLVNSYSASASEILAGAIQDHGKGVLIGTTTFGKGIVQQIITLEDGSAIKLTVSTYFTPNGTNIHGVGIEPDIEIELDIEAYYEEDGFDNQLQKAIDYLKEEVS